MYQIVVEKFPNNELRVTMSTQKISVAASNPGCPDIEKSESPPHEMPESVSRKAGIAPLTLVADSETPSPVVKSGFGSMPRRTVFGLRGKRALIRAGGAIDKTQAQRPQALLTLTLPGSTLTAMAAIAAWSSYAIDRLKTWIYDHSPTSLSMYAWEWQRRGALHLHYVHVCRNRSEFKYIDRHLREEWNKILESICMKSGIDVFEREAGGTWRGLTKMLQTDCTLIQKSAAGYISKYLGKASMPESEKHFCPTQWWGVSRNLNAIVKQNTFTYKKQFLSFLEARKWMNKWHSATIDRAFKCYRYVHKAGGGETFIAFALPDEMETICQELPMLNQSSANMKQPLSTIQNMEQFRRLLTYTEESSMKRSPRAVVDEYYDTMESLYCRDSLPLKLSVHTLSNLLCWSATLSHALRYSHRTRTLRQLLQTSEENFLRDLTTSEHPRIRMFSSRKLEACLLTKSSESCQARTSDRRCRDTQEDARLSTPVQLALSLLG